VQLFEDLTGVWFFEPQCIGFMHDETTKEASILYRSTISDLSCNTVFCIGFVKMEIETRNMIWKIIFTVRHMLAQYSCRNCPSICLSHACFVTKQPTEDILIPDKRAITLIFGHQHWLAGDAPFHLIFALKVTQKCRLRHISACL